MEDWEIDIIEENLTELVKKTECNTMLLNELRQKKLLTQAEKQGLEKLVDTNIKRAENLYDILKKRKGAFQGLIDALNSNDVILTGASAILEKGREEVNAKNEAVLSPKLPEYQTVSWRSERKLQQELPQPRSSNGTTVSVDVDVKDFIYKKEPFRVVLRRPRTKMQFADDFYKLPVDDKGYALFINITDFDDNWKNRENAEKDKNYMCDLWTKLGYCIRPYEGHKTEEKLQKILRDFKEVTKYDASSIVVFIGSRGHYGVVETSDRVTVNILSGIVYKFNAEGCKALNGKPKIFIISACQALPPKHLATTETTNGIGAICVPIEDAIIIYSATPGHHSLIDKHLGSWFTPCLTKVIMENAHRFDLETMIEQTQETMREINGDSPNDFGQVCSFSQPSIFRKLYFNLNP